MKSIDALEFVQRLPSSVKWNTFYFDCYADVRAFCDACWCREAVIVMVNPLHGHVVLVTEEPLKNWDEDAPGFDAVVIDPNGYQLNASYIYMIKE